MELELELVEKPDTSAIVLKPPKTEIEQCGRTESFIAALHNHIGNANVLLHLANGQYTE